MTLLDVSVSHTPTTLQLLEDMLLFRVNSGNPAVPVAQRQAAAMQSSPMPGDSTEQSLSFGKPSSSNTVKTSPLRPAVVEARQQDSQAATTTASPETGGTQQEESREQSAAGPSPDSMQAQDQNVARQQHDLGTSALCQAKPGLSAVETSLSAPSPRHMYDRYTDAHAQPASGPGSAVTLGAQAGAVEPASSSHQIVEQQRNSVATAVTHRSRDTSDPVPAPPSDTDTKLGAAQEGIQRSLEADDSRRPDPGEWHGSL